MKRPEPLDNEHGVACAKIRDAVVAMDKKDPKTWRCMLREMREPGWPDPIELARAAATTPRGKIYDAADGRGGGGEFFRAQLPGPWRYHVELGFDIAIAGGIQHPSMLARHAAHNARVCAELNAGTRQSNELRIIADLFEKYPTQAVDYAAEWIATFDKRVKGAK